MCLLDSPYVLLTEISRNLIRVFFLLRCGTVLLLTTIIIVNVNNLLIIYSLYNDSLNVSNGVKVKVIRKPNL